MNQQPLKQMDNADKINQADSADIANRASTAVRANANDDNDHGVLASAPSAPDDRYWLEQGRKLQGEALTAVRAAAENLLKGIAALQALYLAILGFSKYVPETINTVEKFFFILPLLLWVVAMYFAIQVQMTEGREVNLHVPSEIRAWLNELTRTKQRALELAFGWFAVGLAVAVLVIVLRLRLVRG